MELQTSIMIAISYFSSLVFTIQNLFINFSNLDRINHQQDITFLVPFSHFLDVGFMIPKCEVEFVQI